MVRQVPVAEREPQLRQDERGPQEPRRPEPASPRNEWDERDQPDQELGREHLPEGDEDGERGRSRLHEPEPPPREARPDPEQEPELERRQQPGQGVRPAAAEVLRSVARRDRDAAAEHLMRRQQRRGTQALELQRSPQLAADAVPDAAGREHDEGEEDERRGTGNESQYDETGAPSLAAPSRRDDERDEHRRVQLDRNREPEHGTRDAPSFRDPRCDGGDDERGGPEVEAAEDDRSQSQRR